MTPRAGVKGRVEGNLHVSDDVDWARNDFGERTADDFSQLGTGCAGASNTCPRNLFSRNAGGRACLPHRQVQRLAGLHLSDANDVARSRRRNRQQMRFISHCARGFGASAVDAQVVAHELFLAQSSRPWGFVRGDYRVSLAESSKCPDN